jgi:ABC-2 type transport system ATP-binding protein
MPNQIVVRIPVVMSEVTNNILVRIRGLNFAYGSRSVFDEVDLDLVPGVNFLVGVNGAGKTTLFRILLGDLALHRGTVDMPGLDSNPRGASDNIGYLPQTFGFPPRLTVTEFVSHFAWLQGVPRRVRRERVQEALDRVHLSDRAGERMNRLSGGMMRRAGIAQALVHRPKLVLLDEPTVGLDPRQRMDLRELFAELTPTTTLVISTHLLEDVAALGGHAVVLDAGTVRFSGSVEELALHADPNNSNGSQLDRAFLALTSGTGAAR